MYDCSNYGWSSAYPYQGYYGDTPEYYGEGFVSDTKCLNLPMSAQLCYGMKGLKPTATLSIGGTEIASGAVSPLTGTATLNGGVGNITANVTIKLTDLQELCGNVSGSLCRSGQCKTISYTNICLK